MPVPMFALDVVNVPLSQYEGKLLRPLGLMFKYRVIRRANSLLYEYAIFFIY